MMASTFIVVTTPSENLHLVIIKYNRCTFFEGVTIKQTIRRPQQQQQQQQQQPHPRPSSVTTAASSPATTRAATSPGRASRPARAAATASPSPAPGTRTSPGAATRRRVMLLIDIFYRFYNVQVMSSLPLPGVPVNFCNDNEFGCHDSNGAEICCCNTPL